MMIVQTAYLSSKINRVKAYDFKGLMILSILNTRVKKEELLNDTIDWEIEVVNSENKEFELFIHCIKFENYFHKM